MTLFSRHGLRVFLGGLGVLLLWSPAFSAPKSGKEALDLKSRMAHLFAEYGKLESAAEYVLKTFANSEVEFKSYPLEERLLTAKVYLELEQYKNASIVLYDILKSPEFRQNPDYDATELLYAECLLKLDNKQGAWGHLKAAAQSRQAETASKAQLQLLDLALLKNRKAWLQEIIDLFEERKMTTERRDEIHYRLGKAYLKMNQARKSIGIFGGISENSPYFYRARFYLGASYVDIGQLEQALAILAPLGNVPDSVHAAEAIRTQAALAEGRLLGELGRYSEAISAYQKVDRYSPYYEDSVFEIAWAYIHAEKYDLALDALETLILMTTDERETVEVRSLLGQLHALKDEFEEASHSFEAIISRFLPIRRELESFVKDAQQAERYFKWLLEEGEGQLSGRAPLTERTQNWLDSDLKFNQIRASFVELAQEKSQIQQVLDLAQELEVLFSGPNRMEIFPNLKEAWQETLVLENQLVVLAMKSLDEQGKRLRPQMDDETLGQQEAFQKQREALMAEADGLPQTFAAIESKEGQVKLRYLEMERQYFYLERNLEQLQGQLNSLEEYLRRQQFDRSARGEDAQAFQAAYSEFERAVRKEKEELSALHQSYLQEKRRFELERLSSGAGEGSRQEEGALKRAIMTLIVEEGGFYDGLFLSGVKALPEESERFQVLRQQVLRLIERLDGVLVTLDREAEKSAKEMLSSLTHELGNVQAYRQEAKRLSDEGERLAKVFGEDYFQASLEGLNAVLLDANVGLLDITWAKKNQKTQEIQKINEAQAKRLQALQGDFGNLDDDEPQDESPPSQNEEDGASREEAAP